MMKKNLAYYAQNARSFFDNTVDVDMASLHEAFLSKLAPDASILDAGCGSGRDAKAFVQRGYDVTAFDASAPLARLASEHCGLDVAVRTFSEVSEVSAYDGVWSCASLLHVPVVDLADALGKLWRSLRPGGYFYLSFKLGDGERAHDGRHFTDANDKTLRAWLAPLPEMASVQTWITEDRRPERPDKWINALAMRQHAPGRKLVTGGNDPFLPHLSQAMARATEIDIAVAFINAPGMRLLMPDLLAALVRPQASHPPDAPRRIRVLTSDYLDVTDPEALRLLLLLQAQGADIRVYVTRGSSFHLKAYLFARSVGGHVLEGTAFVGSSNISRQALQDGLEWNYRVTYPTDEGFFEAQRGFDRLFADLHTVELSDGWIESYERRRVPALRASASSPQEQDPPPVATPLQLHALEALAATRVQGFRRGLVVLATGLGKTWLAAFDATSMGARRVLFVAHREEILNQAAQTFLRIRPDCRVGFYAGDSHDVEVDVLCASVHTLGRAAHLERFAAQHFDYVVVDEFHHAAAPTYRRLLRHFAPTFLLGLTATPDRTDQSDILSLCDDNLVFTRNLFEGINAKLLAPFHYRGIFDDAVDYREIPWRNGRFDPEQLSNKLATLARARHAIAQWRAWAQHRTLAFCVSVAHAEFMAGQFNKAGIVSAAVYSGSAMGRTEALDRLKGGRLSVLFSIDLFNEGVDLPSVDTILMLRPTESKILFLQQLGRGLRLSDEKTHLVVLDFIGNHQSFLQKPQALFRVGATFKALAAFGRDAEQGQLTLPDGCYVNYDLKIIDFLKSLNSAGPQQDYEALRSSLGRRPTLAEFYRSGASLQAMRQQHGSWFELVHTMQDLDAPEARAADLLRAFLHEIEVTSMTKSFKMVLLEGLLEIDGLKFPPTLSALAERCWDVLHRRPGLLAELTDAMRELPDGRSDRWQRYWFDNPVKAWTGANRPGTARTFFQIDGDCLRFGIDEAAGSEEIAAALIQELVDYRLAAYDVRRVAVVTPETLATVSNVIPLRPKTTTLTELLFFPNLKIACGHFRTGRTDAEEYRALPPGYGQLDPTRHFVAQASGHSMDGGKNPIRDGDYLLLERVSATNAGSITGTVMAIERPDDSGDDHQYLLRVVTKSPAGTYLLKANNPDYSDMLASDNMRILARLKAILDPLDLLRGRSFSREAIPALFGESFNPGSWHAGHVVLNDKKVHVLLVTLNKQGKAQDHRYHDHWIDEGTFHWQSQNSTTPTTKRGQEIIGHESVGIAIYLFVRDAKLLAGKAAPFVCHGKVSYQSHTGSSPMSVVFSV